jgi:hypothetical protein
MRSLSASRHCVRSTASTSPSASRRGGRRELPSLSFLRRRERPAARPAWRGKTTWRSLGVKACQCGFSVYFTTLDDLIKNLTAADAAGKLKQKMRTYTHKSALLVVDEVGYLPLSRKESNYLFQLVSARYEKSSLILTSNKSFTEWNEILGDEVIAAAILDRLLHHSHVLSIRGQSCRLRDKLNAAVQSPLSGARGPGGQRRSQLT